MRWDVRLTKSAIGDLDWFEKSEARMITDEIDARLTVSPLAETRNMFPLRPNPVAQRELRLRGKYRVMYNVDEVSKKVTIMLVGEKRGEKLIVRGEEYTKQHESNPIK